MGPTAGSNSIWQSSGLRHVQSNTENTPCEKLIQVGRHSSSGVGQTTGRHAVPAAVGPQTCGSQASSMPFPFASPKQRVPTPRKVPATSSQQSSSIVAQSTPPAASGKQHAPTPRHTLPTPWKVPPMLVQHSESICVQVSLIPSPSLSRQQAPIEPHVTPAP